MCENRKPIRVQNLYCRYTRTVSKFNDLSINLSFMWQFSPGSPIVNGSKKVVVQRDNDAGVAGAEHSSPWKPSCPVNDHLMSQLS